MSSHKTVEDKNKLDRLEALFFQALDQPEDQRASFLNRACGDDRQLRTSLEEMLRADQEHTGLIDTASWSVQQVGRRLTSDDDKDPLAQPGSRIGRYRLVEFLGAGGMGSVWLAERTDDEFNQRVALKLIKRGLDTDDILLRFRRERQVLAQLEHPNIARLVDGGATEDGRPYLVMEYVAGRPIDVWCDDRRLTIRNRLQLFLAVCEAVQHAHSKLTVHRDLKPGNILITEDGRPKLLDFGLAKLLREDGSPDSLLVTTDGQRLLTPRYASPEQVRGEPVSTASDVYSLGVLLYELLTGHSPYQVWSGSHREIEHAVTEVDPIRPSAVTLGSDQCAGGQTSTRGALEYRSTHESQLRRLLRGDLDTIVLKALAKDPERRYETVAALTDDLRRHLDAKPISAASESVTTLMRKFVRRNKALTAASAVSVTVLMSATVVSLLYASSESRARTEAKQQRVVAEANARKAIQEAERAQKAEHAAEQRADELKTITEFQQSMLGDIDAEKMGQGIIADLRERVEARLTEGKLDQVTATTALSGFDEAVQGVNATNLALEVVDENVLSRAIETVHEEFADQPLVRAALEQTIADTYREIGLYERAMPLQQAALDTRRHALDDDHPDRLQSISSMGVLLHAMGTYDASLPYFREALEGYRRVWGDDHAHTLDAVGNMGALLEMMGRYDEALPYHREALESSRRVLGDDHPHTLISINNMGGLLYRMDKYEEALLHLGEALEGRRRTLGDDHPRTLDSINNMGVLLYATGKYEEALPYRRKAMEGYRRVLGDDHPTTLISINNMAGLMRDLGRLEEANALGVEAVHRSRRVLPEGHWRIGLFLGTYGKTLLQLERSADAETALLESHSILETALGAKHRQTLKTMNSLFDLYDAWHALEPGAGYDDKAAEWRTRIAEETVDEPES